MDEQIFISNPKLVKQDLKILVGDESLRTVPIIKSRLLSHLVFDVLKTDQRETRFQKGANTHLSNHPPFDN